MSRRRFNVAESGLPDPIFVRYPGSDATASSLAYIFCLHRRVPEKYELCSLNAQGVCKVHPIARVKIFDTFAEDTFRTTFFSSQRCRIPFICRRSLNGSVEFICFADVISTVLRTSSLLEIYLFIPGENILLWSSRLAPIALAERTFPLLFIKDSTKEATMSVCALSGLNAKGLHSSDTWSGFVRTWVMTSLGTMFPPPLMMLWVWVMLELNSDDVHDHSADSTPH